MANNSFIKFFWISSDVSKRHPLKVDFNLGNRKSPLEPNLESRVAGVEQSFRFSPENCAQETMSELVHCHGATPNPGSSTTEASSGVRLPSIASELLYDFRNLSDSQTAILENQITNCIDVNVVCWRGRSSTSGIFINRRSSCFETTVPLKTLRSAHTFVSEGLLKHFPRFSSSFPEFETKFHTDTLFFQVLHFHRLKKSQAGHCTCLLQWLRLAYWYW